MLAGYFSLILLSSKFKKIKVIFEKNHITFFTCNLLLYATTIKEAWDFLKSNDNALKAKNIEQKMLNYAKELQFEKAALLRD